MRFSLIKAACLAAILSSPLAASSQQYYVVVGAFASESNAGEVKGYLPEQVLDTTFTQAEKEKLLHFYVLKTSDKQSAIAKTQQLKDQMQSWTAGQRSAGVESNLAAPQIVTAGLPAEEIPTAAPVENVSERAASGAVSASSGSSGKIPAPPVGKYFQFKIESPDGKLIPGKVHHVDFDKGIELATYKSNTFVDLLKPGQTKPMALVYGQFGYKEVHKFIDYSNPSSTDREAYMDEQGVWVIPYRLERVEEGDVSVMYNVSFYKDAAVMRKSSVTDLDELVNMMHSNPYYEITIHAHCNGKNRREIIAPGPSKNYFDVDGALKVDGTAKDLTELRAEAIRSYLQDHGIDRRRIRIFAWGGSDMLVRPDSPDANVNDRIEIEFTRD